MGIVTDSKFTQNCATEWGQRWARNAWKLANGEDAKLKEPVKRLLGVIAESGIEIIWTIALYHLLSNMDNLVYHLSFTIFVSVCGNNQHQLFDMSDRTTVDVTIIYIYPVDPVDFYLVKVIHVIFENR
ncbi:unnamed protein product [Schistosoma mattheei]|uniref:RNase H type-1 domain-containing protein n=1 Tax=Schistosoma mattheei TaxID=31246 RepID=A0A3P8ADX0_9TREM|nr:unnamed protein product [Schistosoma mattheei]